MSKLMLSLLFIALNFGGSVGTEIGQNDTNITGHIPETPRNSYEYENEEISGRKHDDRFQIGAETPRLRLIY